MNDNLLGADAYNKRTGVHGVIEVVDSLTVTINCNGVDQSVTYPALEKWWNVIPVQTIQEEVVEEPQQPVSSQPEPSHDYNTPDSEKYVGHRLRDKFLAMLINQQDEELTYVYKEKSKAYVIRYRGFNIFEVYATKKRLTILAHPLSLSPANKKRADAIYPKEYGWALRAKFVFDTEDVGATMNMKSILQDGMFYRSQRNQARE